MLHNYLDYIKENFNHINEGSLSSPTSIYWEHQLNKIINNNWSNISVTKFSGKYLINFKCDDSDDDKYSYYSVIIENKNGKDIYYMENPDRFINKFKKEFFKNETEYYKNFVYNPKCLGDIEYLKDSDKYNI